MLAGLQPAPDEVLGDAVDNLRHEVEFGPLPMLPRLAREALNLADRVCRAALEQGDADGFCRHLLHRDRASRLHGGCGSPTLVPLAWEGH